MGEFPGNAAAVKLLRDTRERRRSFAAELKAQAAKMLSSGGLYAEEHKETEDNAERKPKRDNYKLPVLPPDWEAMREEDGAEVWRKKVVEEDSDWKAVDEDKGAEIVEED